MSDWYDCIEPGVRDQVRLLRDNGFNTTCSCEHEHYIEFDFVVDGELQRLHDLLYNTGHKNYRIEFQVTVQDGHLRASGVVTSLHNVD